MPDSRLTSTSAPTAALPEQGKTEFFAGDHAVIEAILQRREQNSKPGRRDDQMHVVLVVEGGGMRGVYTAGMADALESLGLRDSFDEVFGTSSGTYSAAGLTTRQATGAAATYYDELATGEFISMRRAIRRQGPLVSIDHLVDTVLSGTSFDWSPLLDSDIPLRPIATPVDTMRPEIVDGLSSVEDWKLAFKATARIPIAAGSPVSINGRLWIDGAVREQVAVSHALASGATHVLALLSRGPGEQPTPVRRRDRLLYGPLDRIAPGLSQAMRERPARYAESLDILTNRDHSARTTATGQVNSCILRPVASCEIGRLTTDTDKLRAGEQAGIDAVMQIFANEPAVAQQMRLPATDGTVLKQLRQEISTAE